MCSLALNLEGSMTMDLHYETTQAKVKSKLYTSTAFEGTTEVKGYKFVNLVFDLPKIRSDIISIEYVKCFVNKIFIPTTIVIIFKLNELRA